MRRYMAAIILGALAVATAGCVVAPAPEPEWVPGYWGPGPAGWMWFEGYWVDRGGWSYRRHGWDHDYWIDHGGRDHDGWRDHDRWQGGGPDRHRPAPPPQGSGKLRPGR